MKGLIVSSGTILNYEILKSLVEDANFIICADGGMDHLLKIRKEPNLLVGDLDSISQESLKFIKEKNIPTMKFPVMKDSTDTGIAMEYLIDKEYSEITLIGVTGTRLDHTLANIHLLNTLLEKGIKGKIVDDNNIIYLIDEKLEIESVKDRYLSIIPISVDGIIISLEGFLYNLDKKFIDFGSTHCISNKIVAERGIIQIHSGKALLFLSKD